MGVTDQEWFDFLSRRPDLDEVNFWTPHPGRGEFRRLERGELFLFKLKAPYNAIGGGGFFEHFTRLPVSMAWAAFEEKNGAGSPEATRERIARLRRDNPKPWEDYVIGCIVLLDPFFWPMEDWIPQPSDWRREIVQGKGYDLTVGMGRELWRQVVDRLDRHRHPSVGGDKSSAAIPGGYGEPVPRPTRLGQGTFRVVVMDTYERQCAITAERALPTLDAVHIRPFSLEPKNYINNGVLLRSDIHRLFEAGYLTVTPGYRVEVSHRIRDDFDDGEYYLRLRGTEIFRPRNLDQRPDPEILRWHNENRFRG